MSRCDDFCCNHGCNQGRNCPARSTDVARVGKQHPRVEPNFTPAVPDGPDMAGEVALVLGCIALSLFALGFVVGAMRG